MGDTEHYSIGTVRNYYGGVSVFITDGKYYWAIEDYNGYGSEEITKELYDALKKFEEERNG